VTDSLEIVCTGEALQALVGSKKITIPTIVVTAGCGFEDTFGVFASAIAFQAGDAMMFRTITPWRLTPFELG
jgi:hypothetical protein